MIQEDVGDQSGPCGRLNDREKHNKSLMTSSTRFLIMVDCHALIYRCFNNCIVLRGLYVALAILIYSPLLYKIFAFRTAQGSLLKTIYLLAFPTQSAEFLLLSFLSSHQF